MNTKGIRWTHPDEEQIGQHFRGHTERALRGEPFTETYTGTLGPSVRAVVPIYDGGGIRPTSWGWSARASASRRSARGSRTS